VRLSNPKKLPCIWLAKMKQLADRGVTVQSCLTAPTNVRTCRLAALGLSVMTQTFLGAVLKKSPNVSAAVSFRCGSMWTRGCGHGFATLHPRPAVHFTRPPGAKFIRSIETCHRPCLSHILSDESHFHPPAAASG